jgi:UDP-N-acetylmuramyl pentapeptide phosphotransferase/UDP-N-acetylglucosamine-1-phosphate transferase
MSIRAVASGAIAGAGAALALHALRASPPAGHDVWERTSHAGSPVSLLEGPAYVAGAVGAAAVMGSGAGPLVAVLGAGSLGALDDLAGDSRSKGLKGHLGALARGEVTTGAVKIAGLAATGLVSALLVDGRHGRRGHDAAVQGVGLLDSLVGGAVVAGSANLLNLLDLRPGRALKATVIAGALTATSPRSEVAAATATGAALGLLAPDLAGQTMLGDTGANSAGALLGAALVQRTGRRGRLAALAVLAALTLASERISFTRVIESTPGLRELDALGRR